MLDFAQTRVEAGPMSEAELLAARLAPDVLPLRSQVEVAGGFVLRALAPLLGRELPDLGEFSADLSGLQAMIRARQAWLAELTPEQFVGAGAKQISSDAGPPKRYRPPTSWSNSPCLTSSSS